MDIYIFNEMNNDKYSFDLKKLQYKYPDRIHDYLMVLKDIYLRDIPVRDFSGKNIMYMETKAKLNMNCYKLLMQNKDASYGKNAIEEEIISTSKIENIDFSRESVRNVLSGFAVKNEEENRILGMKRGFEFISDISNEINEDNIYKLYMMTIGDFLDDENKLLHGEKYRHDSVVVSDLLGNISHVGINHSSISEYMQSVIEYINSSSNENDFVKAAIIHFCIAYIHPYFDGNGRMARLIHLWYLIQSGFSNTLFIPFSSYILKSIKKYYKAYTLIEENQKITGVIDVTPFILYFSKEVYNKLEEFEIDNDVYKEYKIALDKGYITKKEEKLWNFVVDNYGKNGFSTKMLQRDFGDAAYATIRGFVLKFEYLGLFSSNHFSNRVVYKIV